jgi:glucose/arabinose dehydrogenase
VRSPRLPIAVLIAIAVAGCGGGDDGDKAATADGAKPRGPTTEDRGPSVTTVTENLDAPWDLAFLPDGRALLNERAGKVRLLDRGRKLRARPAAEVPVEQVGESGLLGLAIDPGFADNHLVYLYRTGPAGNAVLRYRLEGDHLTEQGVVLDGIRKGPIHDGGRIRFGPDGLLYVSTGETGDMALAQDRRSLNGKILRVRGFRGKGSAQIVSLGHRNVQGFDWEPKTNRLVATEFGPDSDDEVNVIRQGGNYGWPDAQGKEGAPRYVEPVVDYEQVIAPSGATFVRHPGSAWTGSFVFGALVGEQIRRVKLDGDRVTANETLFKDRYGRIRTVVEGPDGALYALTNNTDGRGSPREGDDRILRIVPPRR